MRLDFSRIAWPEVEAAVARGVVAVLATGACEQHGAHLPLTTDTDMAQGQAERIADALDALLLPPVTYGEAWNNEAFPGTISLSAETLRAVVIDIGRGCARMGLRGLIVVNGHFGNRAPLALAVQALAPFPVLMLDYPGLDRLAAQINDSPPAGHGFMHADEFETSVMLAVAPGGVRMDLAQPQYPTFPEDYFSRPQQIRTFNQTGVFGDPRPATAAKGRAFLDGIAAESLTLIAGWRDSHGI
jgi:creatinine amidohydrolase